MRSSAIVSLSTGRRPVSVSRASSTNHTDRSLHSRARHSEGGAVDRLFGHDEHAARRVKPEANARLGKAKGRSSDPPAFIAEGDHGLARGRWFGRQRGRQRPASAEWLALAAGVSAGSRTDRAIFVVAVLGGCHHAIAAIKKPIPVVHETRCAGARVRGSAWKIVVVGIRVHARESLSRQGDHAAHPRTLRRLPRLPSSSLRRSHGRKKGQGCYPSTHQAALGHAITFSTWSPWSKSRDSAMPTLLRSSAHSYPQRARRTAWSCRHCGLISDAAASCPAWIAASVTPDQRARAHRSGWPRGRGVAPSRGGLTITASTHCQQRKPRP